jgi:hypothetical protein
VYSSHRIFEIASTLVQTACSLLSVYFSMIGLTISASKSEIVLFARQHFHQWFRSESMADCSVSGSIL